MKRIVAALMVGALLPSPGWAQHRGLNLQATPEITPHGSALLPVPPARPLGTPAQPRRQPGPNYDVAPTPNRDLDGPLAPRASNSPELAPGIFTRGQQYRGEGYSPGSSAQAAQERRAQPGAGFKLRLPFQQE